MNGTNRVCPNLSKNTEIWTAELLFFLVNWERCQVKLQRSAWTKAGAIPHASLLVPLQSQKFFFTFQTADPPQPRVGEGPGVFLVLVVGVVLADVGRGVTDDRSGVQPVVRPDRHRHQAEGGEGPHGGEEDLDPLLTHHAFISGGGGRGKRKHLE